MDIGPIEVLKDVTQQFERGIAATDRSRFLKNRRRRRRNGSLVQLTLTAKEVNDEGRVNARFVGDGAQPRAIETGVSKGPSRGIENRLPRVASAGSSTSCCHAKPSIASRIERLPALPRPWGDC